VAVAWDGRPALDALSLDVLDGEVFALLGPSGYRYCYSSLHASACGAQSCIASRRFCHL
jgi:ABC-type hemin transport system ATPase subunit